MLKKIYWFILELKVCWRCLSIIPQLTTADMNVWVECMSSNRKKKKKKCWTSILTNLYYIFLLILNLSLKAFGNEDSQIFHEPQQNDISIGN